MRPAFCAVPALLWLAMLLLGGAASAFDPLLLGALYAGDRPGLASAARMVTELGSWRLLLPLALAAAALLAFRRRYRVAGLLLAITIGGRIAVDLQKLAISRLRPDLHEPLVDVVSASFPSGHAANSAITLVGLAWLLSGHRGWIAAAALLSLAIGLSRVMLGVHWPSDVIGGWSFALLWLVALLPPIGNSPRNSFIFRAKESDMIDTKRTETARDHDDSDLIEDIDPAPGQGGASGGNLQRDISSRDEQRQAEGKAGLTRVGAKDKREEANVPRYNER